LSEPVVTLEIFNRGIARELFDALQAPAIYAHIDDEPPSDFERYALRCERLENTISTDGKDRWFNWAVRADARIVGYVQATVYPYDHAAELAYVLNPAAVGRGIAFNATKQMMALVERECDVREYWMTILHTNARSIALAHRLGFVRKEIADYPYQNFGEGDLVFSFKTLAPSAGA
jgi:RimJ/RimL family protein N-acetyltransferase